MERRDRNKGPDRRETMLARCYLPQPKYPSRHLLPTLSSQPPSLLPSLYFLVPSVYQHRAEGSIGRRSFRAYVKAIESRNPRTGLISMSPYTPPHAPSTRPRPRPILTSYKAALPTPDPSPRKLHRARLANPFLRALHPAQPSIRRTRSTTYTVGVCKETKTESERPSSSTESSCAAYAYRRST